MDPDLVGIEQADQPVIDSEQSESLNFPHNRLGTCDQRNVFRKVTEGASGWYSNDLCAPRGTPIAIINSGASALKYLVSCPPRKQLCLSAYSNSSSALFVLTSTCRQVRSSSMARSLK